MAPNVVPIRRLTHANLVFRLRDTELSSLRVCPLFGRAHRRRPRTNWRKPRSLTADIL
jgi:hypothetical protein